MKKFILSLLLAALLAFSAASGVLAVEDAGTREFTVPVTLTVARSTKHINVTLPAAMPVSVLDGKVLTADNLQIRNHSDSLAVRVAAVEVSSAGFTVADYEDFHINGTNQIALWINGCVTEGPGLLALDGTGFPEIAAGGVLPIRYNAKVSAAADVNETRAANVIFTLKAV